MNIEQQNMHFIVGVLSDKYPDEVTKMKHDYKYNNDLRYQYTSLEEYILKNLPSHLQEEITDFKTQNAKCRITETARLFSRENCSTLWKKHYPTGFNQLDDALDGGFTAGVHFIGAVSSLGKSTLALQIADHMGSLGNHIIYFSMEMSREQLAAKLISMHTLRFRANDKRAKTANQLTSESMKYFEDEDWDVVNEARRIVSENGIHTTICADCGDAITIDAIAKYVKDYIATYEVKPVVFIDYLQILAAPEKMLRATDKQNVDYNIRKIRMMASKYDIPVIVISSFNRESYKNQVSFQSFKESGNIEYSCDTMIGLQYKGVGTEGFNVDEAKAKYPRMIELIILKQRYGPTGAVIQYKFYTKYNKFEEQVFQEIDSSKTDNQFTQEKISAIFDAVGKRK